MAQSRIEWDDQPTQIKIKLKPEQVKKTIVAHDMAIIMDIGGARYEALVPTHTLGEGNSYVPAAKVGRRGDKVVLFFPVSNDGRPCWQIPEADLEPLLIT